jgi:hypothetical protein
VGFVTDGNYCPKNDAKLKELGYNSLSDADVDKICNKQISTPEVDGEEITVDTTNTDF